MLLPVPVVAFAVRYFGEIIHRLSEQIQAALGMLSTRAQENLTGIRVIRAYAQEKPEIEAFDQANRHYVNRNIKLIGTWSLFFPVSHGAHRHHVCDFARQGRSRDVIDQRFTVGTMWAFYWFLGQLVFPMIALGWVTNIFQRGAASMGRLNYILHAEPRISDSVGAVRAARPVMALDARTATAIQSRTAEPESAIRGEIEFRHLTFTYPTARNDDGTGGEPGSARHQFARSGGLDARHRGPDGQRKIHARGADCAAVGGASGHLVHRRPLDSRISAGRSCGARLDTCRKTRFFSAKRLRENIAFGVSNAVEEHIFEAAEIASISGEIQIFPQRYETMVGERGITLSGGQKQRTSIARAVLRQPKILILDDALSSVDTDTEERILRRLRDVMRAADYHFDFAPRFHRKKRRPDRSAARWTHHRTRHARRIAGAGRVLRRLEPEAIAGRRTGTRMSDFREEEKLGKLYDSQITRRLMQYLRPYRMQVVVAVSFTLAITAMELAGPYLFAVGIGHYIVPGFEGTISRTAALVGLLRVALEYAGSILLSFGLQYVQVRIMQWIGQQTMYDLRREIFEHLQRLPMSFFDSSPVGRLVTRATTDVDALNDLFASGVVAMLNDFVLLFALAIVLFKWNRPLAFAAFSPLPFMILLTYFFRNRVRDANRRIRTAIARINAFLQEHVSGMAVVQLFNRERKSRTKFEELNRIHMGRIRMQLTRLRSFIRAWNF